MTINDQNRDEKLQYDINKKAAKYQLYHHSPLGKAFEKQIKTIEDQEQKQIKGIQN